MKSEKILSKSSNKKGLWCPFKPILCQEGYCHECQIYPDWQRRNSAVTAYAMKGDKERVIESGCDAYLSKPINTRQLPEMIAEMLLQRRKDKA